MLSPCLDSSSGHLQFDTYLVTALYRLHRTLPACSQEKINSLYCFDSISRACRSKVKRGIGARIEKTGTFAGFLQQVEGVLDGLIEDLVGKQDWKEGRVSIPSALGPQSLHERPD
jgi:hypothetical protein